MPKSLFFDLRSRVFAAIDAGLSCCQAVARFGVSTLSAIRWQALRRLGGDGVPSRKAATGCRGAPRHTAISFGLFLTRLPT
jgi:transposase